MSENTNSSVNLKEAKYATLMETNDEECESWYSFIKYDGNEENLRHLKNQLETVDWYLLENASTFDLELDFLVSAQTAKEMTKVELNTASPHRKFDGTLQKIDLRLKKNHLNEKKMRRVFDKLGYGQIENYVDQEDCNDENIELSSGGGSSDSEEKSSPEKRRKGIPPAPLKSTLPRIAKAKQHRKKGTKKRDK